VPCTEPTSRPWHRQRLWARPVLAALVACLGLSACGTRAPAPKPAAVPPPSAAAKAPPAGASSAMDGRAGGAVAIPAAPQRPVALPDPPAPRTRQELQWQVARRLVQAHPDGTYLSRAPDRLMAIPVLEIELNADGSVRRIEVLRHPSTGDEATRLAIAAVRRAAPYGDVSRLPRPWKVVETFLFNDEMRFKPRILDLQ
jgi:outer membrane biosynthesis protein TonB